MKKRQEPNFHRAYMNYTMGKELLQREKMNFQTHLYELGEMEGLLKEAGFTSVAVYSSFQKEIAVSNQSEQFLYECTAD